MMLWKSQICKSITTSTSSIPILGGENLERQTSERSYLSSEESARLALTIKNPAPSFNEGAGHAMRSVGHALYRTLRVSKQVSQDIDF